MRKLFIISAALLSSVLSAQDLTILHLNDTHSHIEPERCGLECGLGGVIEQAAYIDSVRCAEGRSNVVLLHAGDFSQGTSYFTEFNGDIEVQVMNAMEFDATCLGNHEFDNGLDELARRIRSLNVPVTCANYDFSRTPLKGLVKPYVIVQKGNRKIGVIGLLTDLSTVVSSEMSVSLKYQQPIEVAERYARQLKAEGCDLVIALTHIGYDDDVALARGTRNVDIVVGGHSHTVLDEMTLVRNLDGKEVRIVTTGKWGIRIGNLSVDFQPNRLTAMYDPQVLPKDASWFPYPEYDDGKAWEALIGEHRDFLIRQGEKYLKFTWRSIDATAYLAYEYNGDRQVMETPLKENRLALNALMLAELAEGEGRFMNQLLNGLWHISHMPSWVLSAHLPRQNSGRSLPDPSQQIIDLGSGALGAQMAVAYHIFHKYFDEVDPVISKVIKAAVKKQVLDPYLDPGNHKAHWWLAYDIKPGTVVNNWNPWCNADVILCFLLLEDDRERLEQAVRQSLKSVDKFLAYVKSDGACEEGPAYWGHAAGKLYDYLQIMHDATGGRISLFDDKQIRDMGEYISRSYVADGWVVNFADASARLSFTPSLIYNYGKAVSSQEMMDFAIYNLGRGIHAEFDTPDPVVWNDIYRALESLKSIGEMTSRVEDLNKRIGSKLSFSDCLAGLRASVPQVTWYPQTQFCYIKNKSDWFFAAKGGHNNESHNHNDIGTFILYKGGVPMFVDAGVGTYTKKTFSSERYTIWSMQSLWHNLPAINGVAQMQGAEYRASSVSVQDDSATKIFSLDISGAYPKEAACRSWSRKYEVGDSSLLITDSYELTSRTNPDVVNFIIQGRACLPGEEIIGGYVVKKGEIVIINYDAMMKLSYPKDMKPFLETVLLDDVRLSNVWGRSLTRISLTSRKKSPLTGSYVFEVTEFN